MAIEKPINEIGKSKRGLFGNLLELFFPLSLFFLGLVIGQVSQQTYSQSDLMMKVIDEWKIENPEEAHIADLLVDKCRPFDVILFVASNCFKENGGEDTNLKYAIINEISVLNNHPWPISMASK